MFVYRYAYFCIFWRFIHELSVTKKTKYVRIRLFCNNIQDIDMDFLRIIYVKIASYSCRQYKQCKIHYYKLDNTILKEAKKEVINFYMIVNTSNFSIDK